MFRVMRLEIARLKSQISVSHAVRFGKSVIRKLGHQRKYLLGLVLLDAPRHRPQNELLLLPRHLFTVLLAHRFAQTVGFRHRITGQLLRQLHRLFLIDDYSVRPSLNSCIVFSSLSKTFAHTISSLSMRFMLFKQSLIIVSVLSARKSILSTPTFSRSVISYCVVTSSLAETAIGISS